MLTPFETIAQLQEDFKVIMHRDTEIEIRVQNERPVAMDYTVNEENLLPTLKAIQLRSEEFVMHLLFKPKETGSYGFGAKKINERAQ